MYYVAKHLLNPFYLEGTQRRSEYSFLKFLFPSRCGTLTKTPLQSSRAGDLRPPAFGRLSVPVLQDPLAPAQKNKRRKYRLLFSLPTHKKPGHFCISFHFFQYHIRPYKNYYMYQFEPIWSYLILGVK